MKSKCPFCQTDAFSIVEYQNNVLGYLISFIVFIVFGWLAFCLIPFVFTITKTAVHRCPRCLNQMKNNSMMGFSSMDDKVGSG